MMVLVPVIFILMLFRSSVVTFRCRCCWWWWFRDSHRRERKRKKKVNENKHIILVSFYFFFYFFVVVSFPLCIPHLPLHLVLFRFYSLERSTGSSEGEKVFFDWVWPQAGWIWKNAVCCCCGVWTKRITRQSLVWKNAKKKTLIAFCFILRTADAFDVDLQRSIRWDDGDDGDGSDIHLFLLSLMNFRPFHFDFYGRR